MCHILAGWSTASSAAWLQLCNAVLQMLKCVCAHLQDLLTVLSSHETDCYMQQSTLRDSC